ncbi:MAG: orotidine-5'-phosphate decarboxylase [Gemmatimonadales bacterium]
MPRRPDLAIALDLPDARAALALVDAVGGEAAWYKVGPVLFVRDGPAVVQELKRRGKRVFLDLKWHDIPSTVAGAVTAAVALGCELATLHLAGGRAMLEAAARSRNGSGLKLIGVGVLTSFNAADYGAVMARDVSDVGDEQERLVRFALGTGLDGFVAGAQETPRVRRVAGAAALLVSPGIRRSGAAADDQRRVATPAEAVRAGSDLLVVGRPVSGASDPAAEVKAIRREMAGPVS